MAGGRKKRVLSTEEKTLWTHVTQHVAPLRSQKSESPVGDEPVITVLTHAPSVAPPQTPKSKSKVKAVAAKPAITTPAKPPSVPDLPPIVPLEHRMRKKLSRGSHPIDGKIDLHGMRQAEAHEALRGFILNAHRAGHSVVLVVTGKGGTSSGGSVINDERGVLRRVVPQWLRMADLRPCIIGFEQAVLHHGGSGALYVRIRRKRAASHPS